MKLQLRSRYIQISLAFAFMITVFQVSTLAALGLEFWEPPVFWPMTVTLWAYLPFQILFIGLLFVPERRASRLVQVFGIAGFALSSIIFVTWREVAGDLVYVLAIIVAYKYGFIERNRLRTVLLAIAPLIVARIGLILYGRIENWRAFNQIAISMATTLILYAVFESELNATRRRAAELADHVAVNAPFIEFGRNVGGVVHDFRNDLSLLVSFGSLLATYKGETVNEDLVTQYRSYVARIQERVDNILFVTRDREAGTPEVVAISQVIASVMYVFEANLEFKRVVRFATAHVDPRLRVTTLVAPLVSIIENAVRNSCEALVDFHDTHPDLTRRAEVTVEAVVIGSRLMVRIRDNGPGIPGCAECDGENCLDCPALKPGFSTKPTGSGIGLANIRRAAQMIGASIRMSSRATGGVETEVLLPPDSVAVVAADQLPASPSPRPVDA